MNLFQLLLKQLRQRALSSSLTVLSIALGVGLAISILVMQRGSENLFAQTDYGYEVLAGVKGSGLQLTVNTVYRIDKSPGNVKWAVYENLLKNPLFRRNVKIAIPQCVGDSYNGFPIVGTTPQFFAYDNDGKRIEEAGSRFEYRPGKSFEFAEGKPFKENRFEAVIGSEVAKKSDLKLGSTFHATHGFPVPGQTPDVHAEEWTVTGVLAPTGTANDKCVYIGLTSFYTIFEHAEAEIARDAIRTGAKPPTPGVKPKDDHDHAGHDHGEDEVKHYAVAPDGTILLDKEVVDAREVSAILIKARGQDGTSGFSTMNLINNLNLQPDVMAVNPASVMRDFFGNFVKGPTLLLLAIAALVILVAAIGVLTTIYNAIASRVHEIAVLRALGATKNRILVMVAAEATVLGLGGAVIGLVFGHGLAAAGSAFMAKTFGEGFNWAHVTETEIFVLIGTVVLSCVAGLVPALKAYRTPVATNLAG
ncbi:MAG: ABC transporter permease [Tepidisphaeraceae bacterium]